jgi:hypothetical protein
MIGRETRGILISQLLVLLLFQHQCHFITERLMCRQQGSMFTLQLKEFIGKRIARG